MLCLAAQSCLILCDPMDYSPPGSSVHWNSPGKNTGMGCHALLQGIFPTQGLNPGLLHCRRILYHLSHPVNYSVLCVIKYSSVPGTAIDLGDAKTNNYEFLPIKGLEYEWKKQINAIKFYCWYIEACMEKKQHSGGSGWVQHWLGVGGDKFCWLPS